MRIHAAAPLEGLQILAMRQCDNLLRLALGAMVAPQVVLVERLHLRVYRHYAGAGGVKGDGLDFLAADARFFYRQPCSNCERTHVVGMRLRCIIWVLAATMKRIFRYSGAQTAALAVQN